MHSVKVVVFGQKVVFGIKWLYSGKVVVFGQKWLYSGKSGCIWAKWLYSGKSGCIWAGKNCFYREKVVVFVIGQKIWAKVVVKSGFIVVFKNGCKSCSIQAKVVVFGYLGKVVFFGQNGCIWAKVVLFGQKVVFGQK